MKLAKAISTALKSTHPRFRHASLILKGGALMASGYNHDWRHAEAVALGLLFPKTRGPFTMVNIRIRKDGSFGMSKPCPSCLELMRENGIGKVIYSDKTGKFVMERV